MKAERKYKILASQKSSEPTWTDKVATQGEIIKGLQWYNENKNNEAAAKYLGIKDAKLASFFLTLAWSMRMVSRGCILPEREAATARKMEEDFRSKIKPPPAQTTKKVVNIQELIAAKADSFIAELEGLVDEYGIKGDVKSIDFYRWMQQSEVKPAHIPFIITHFREQAKEPFAAAQGKDPELVEGYSSYSKKRLMNLLQCYSAIIKNAEKFVENKKVARAPRKKKPVSADKKVSKIMYMKSDSKLKLQSVDPVKIVGAQQLWVYNTKTRKLGVYNALDASGLSVKGSAIVGFVGNTSISKTLRKPEKILSQVVSGGKLVLRKVLDEINSKPALLNGRVNKDTILLRVV